MLAACAYLDQAGFRVRRAITGEDGLALVAAEQPGLAVVDIGLPGSIDGLGVCRGSRLAQIAGNLVENARRHAGTAVQVTVESDGRDAVLTVDDDGPGIAATDRDRVFEPLYGLRPPSSHGARKETGTGLGLTTVRALATAMGGSAQVADADIGGARLVVRLPLRSP